MNGSQGRSKTEIALSLWKGWLASKGIDVPDEELAARRGMSVRAFDRQKKKMSAMLTEAKKSLARAESSIIQGHVKEAMPVILGELSKKAPICLAVRKHLGGKGNYEKNPDSDRSSTKVRPKL